MEFRKQLMEKILQSSNEKTIELVINDAINLMIEKGTNMHIVNRFAEKLEADLYVELDTPHDVKESLNFKEALRVIKEFNMKNSTVLQ